MTLPQFLQRLEDASFHVLSALEPGRIRMAAVDATVPEIPVFCRLFELNVVRVNGTPGAEEQLYWGIQPDEILFDGTTIVLDRSNGDPDAFHLELELETSLPGRYCDCEILEGNSTEQIKAATAELVGTGEVIWRDLSGEEQ